ncbi:MAG: hypothetical protein V4510_13050 [bacterium]
MTTKLNGCDPEESEEAIRRVKKGAALLDERVFAWRDRVEADTFDIASGANCILGQTFRSMFESYTSGGAYEQGRNVLGLGHEAAVEHGFNAGGSEADQELYVGYTALGLAWELALWPDMFKASKSVTTYEKK